MNPKQQKLFYTLTAPSVDRYLTLNGWIRDFAFKNPNLMVFTFPEKNKKLAIPTSETFDDFYINLEETLQTISAIEKKPVAQIIKEISTVFFDRMEFRIISNISDDGKLPLEYASNCIEGLKELVLYSACAEQNARPICFKASNIAQSYLNSFKLAQTELGSFIINVDIQVVNENSEQMVFDTCDIPKPFEHKVVERIYNAMSQVDSVVMQQKTLTQVTEDGYQSGITANMCEALLKMKPDVGDVEIDTTIRYASALTRATAESKHIVVKSNHFWVMDEISKIYRDKVEMQDVTLTGIVKSLSKHEHEELTEKTIRLVTHYDSKLRTISMDLSDADYIIACNAHRDEQEVEVSGTLDMSRKIWELTNISSFKIL